MQSPPKFKFKIISTFGDPLTRQIAESVRIERSGMEILNSRSEYSRCRIPRLRIDMEGWKEANLQGKKVSIVDVKDSTEDTIEKDMEDLEDASRRQESKRKTEDDGIKRRSKKIKFSRLEGWGDSEQDGEDLGSSRQEIPEEWMKKKKRVENPSKDMVGVIKMDSFDELFKKKKGGKEIAAEDKKEVKRVRGKLSKEEVEKYKKSNHNVFDWLSKGREERRRRIPLKK